MEKWEFFLSLIAADCEESKNKIKKVPLKIMDDAAYLIAKAIKSSVEKTIFPVLTS